MDVKKDPRMPMILAVNDSTYHMPSKQRTYKLVNDIVNGLVEGDSTALDCARLRILSKAIDRALKEDIVLTTVEEELQNEVKQTASFNGVTVSIGKSAPRYDYSVCGHPEYDRIIELMNILNDRKKQIEEELKLLYKSSMNPTIGQTVSTKTVVVEELLSLCTEPSGEVATVNPPDFTYSKSIFVK